MRPLLPLLLLSTFALASDPVITLDYAGGFTPPRVRKDPYLAIDADGKIRACNPFTKDEPREDKMSKQALKKLIEELEPKIDSLKKVPTDAPVITDASTTVIRVGKRTAKQYALGYYAREFPKNKQLQALRSAQERLDLIWRITMVGGRKKADAALESANKALKKEWPKAQPFTFTEMAVYRDTVTFRRQEKKRWIAITLKDGKVSVEKGG